MTVRPGDGLPHTERSIPTLEMENEDAKIVNYNGCACDWNPCHYQPGPCRLGLRRLSSWMGLLL